MSFISIKIYKQIPFYRFCGIKTMAYALVALSIFSSPAISQAQTFGLYSGTPTDKEFEVAIKREFKEINFGSKTNPILGNPEWITGFDVEGEVKTGVWEVIVFYQFNGDKEEEMNCHYHVFRTGNKKLFCHVADGHFH